MEWAEREGKSLVSATESHFDTLTSAGRLIAMLVASFAEMELEAISARSRNAFVHNFSQGKWRGGVPMGVSSGGGGWGVAASPRPGSGGCHSGSRGSDFGGRESGENCADLTEREILTSKDRFAQADVDFGRWTGADRSLSLPDRKCGGELRKSDHRSPSD